MKTISLFFAVSLLAGLTQLCYAQTNQPLPSVIVRATSALRLPGGRLPEAGIYDSIDCNSPLHWDMQGNLHVFSSVQHPFHSSGPDLFRLNNPLRASLRVNINARATMVGGIWLEATYRDTNGLLYGWYHNERSAGCANSYLTMPRIGQMVSSDEGQTWQDLGIIMQAGDSMTDCATGNYYFAGGEGDFTVVLDQARQYFYFFFGSYHDAIAEQGVCVARLAYAERNNPAGKVWKWYKGQWREPGLGGHTAPIFPVLTDWHRRDANALWGPSVHYNTYLESYVMVLNHAVNGEWAQEGIYISYNKNPNNPFGWSTPVRLPLDPGGRAYPQVVGMLKGETDKLVGQTGKLFLLGESNFELVFLRPNEWAGLSYFNTRPTRQVNQSRQNLPVRIR